MRVHVRNLLQDQISALCRTTALDWLPTRNTSIRIVYPLLYGLAQAIFTLGEKLQFFPQLRGRQHWTICSSLHNCVLAKLHCCAQIQQRRTLKNISLHVQLCMCTYALICSSLMCCNMQCARTDILHPYPPRILLSACIAICVSVPAPYIPWIGFLWLRMHCHWDFNAGHRLQQQTREGTSSTLHPQATPFICLLCFILVPSIFCSSPKPSPPTSFSADCTTAHSM